MQGIEKLYHLYFADVYHYLLHLCRDKPLAEELTSDVFFKLIKQGPQIQHQEATKSYLLTMAKNAYIDHLKKKRLDLVPLDDLELDGAGSPEQELVRQDKKQAICSAIDRLKEPQKTIAKLRLVMGASFAEIGAFYQKSPNWACVTFHRARKQLQQELEDFNDD